MLLLSHYYLPLLNNHALFKFLVDKWEFVEVRVTNSEGRVYRERSEPNSEPRLRGDIK